MPSGLLFQTFSSVIASLDALPSCSLFDLAGVRGHFASWTSPDRQRDSSVVDVKHLRKFFSRSLQIVLKHFPETYECPFWGC